MSVCLPLNTQEAQENPPRLSPRSPCGFQAAQTTRASVSRKRYGTDSTLQNTRWGNLTSDDPRALWSSGRGDNTLLSQTRGRLIVCRLPHRSALGSGGESVSSSFDSPCFHVGDAQNNTGHPKQKTEQMTHPVKATPKQKPKKVTIQPRPELWRQRGTRGLRERHAKPEGFK